MKYLDQTLQTPKQNLELDEALLEACETGSGHEALRFWESKMPFVVVGYANQIAREVKTSACERDGIQIVRRVSGGGAVLQGPGCLNYCLVLKMTRHALKSTTQTNCVILKKHREALGALSKENIQFEGYSDLTLNHLKFSGNSQRRKRNCLLFHGTFLYQFDISKVKKYLRMPSKQPPYRKNRAHQTFLTNLDLMPYQIKEALKKTWSAS
jgi:lipoate---protein ligase